MCVVYVCVFVCVRERAFGIRLMRERKKERKKAECRILG